MSFIEDLFGVPGKTALVTGGASGLGRMMAEALVQGGARVLIASRKGEECEAAAAELNALGASGSAEGFAGDVSTAEGCAELAAEVKRRTGVLHILVNNAGKSWGAPYEDFPFHGWEKVLSVNLAGLFTLTRDLTSLLKAAATPDDPARIVNIGSVAGETPTGDLVYSYSASKAAVHHLTKVLAKELAPSQVTVNALAPGPFVSKMTKHFMRSEETRAQIAGDCPMGRIGAPSDIQGCILFLCGKSGAYVTGSVIPVSGGINVNHGHKLFGGVT